MFGSLGKKLNKSVNWLGKTALKGIHTAQKANNFIGKSLDSAGNLYSNVKNEAISLAHKAGVGQEVGSIIRKIEHSPLGSSLSGLYDTAKDASADIGIIANGLERDLKRFGKKKRNSEQSESSELRNFRSN